jgi:pyrimidine operon attenuation protein/uracil phosphoribosyltransferase
MRKVVERPSRPALVDRRCLADGADIARMLRRIGHEIAERNRGLAGVALVGIRTGGLHLARRLQALLGEIEGQTPPLGALDIALYRDDIADRLRPEIGTTELPFELAGTRVVLVDDVLYTGRTVRAALDALMDWGRPRAVQLAVLVDRGHRELPIRADYVGTTVETEIGDRVVVEFTGDGAAERVVLRGPAAT